MINKCRVEISGRVLYKRRRSSWPGDRKREEEKIEKEKRDRDRKRKIQPQGLLPQKLGGISLHPTGCMGCS